MSTEKIRKCRFFTADVFTSRIFGGNPLAVLPQATGLTAEQMQSIAREFNFSETVFVLPARQASNARSLRIFTPGAEVPFAGHPTIGTAHVLASVGELKVESDETRIVLEEGVGPVPVLIRSERGKPVFAQLTAPRLPEVGPVPPPAAALAEVLGIEAGEILDGRYAPEALSCGIPFVFIPVRNRQVLRRTAMRLDSWRKVLASFWAPQVFVFSFDPEGAGSHLRARMFAPQLGLVEDPATGAAAVALAGYMAAREPLAAGSLGWVIEQGFEMGRPSILAIEADKEGGRVSAVRVGGASVLVSEGTMALP
jgi:trans-2,3-dihydro-3-hydroxyanthranilate isomerase